jgi:hypothetical protein
MKDFWANRSEGHICARCIHFVKKKVQNKQARVVGRCRRHAPVVQEGYPVVYSSFAGCGDFKLSEEKA